MDPFCPSVRVNVDFVEKQATSVREGTFSEQEMMNQKVSSGYNPDRNSNDCVQSGHSVFTAL